MAGISIQYEKRTQKAEKRAGLRAIPYIVKKVWNETTSLQTFIATLFDISRVSFAYLIAMQIRFIQCKFYNSMKRIFLKPAIPRIVIIKMMKFSIIFCRTMPINKNAVIIY